MYKHNAKSDPSDAHDRHATTRRSSAVKWGLWDNGPSTTFDCAEWFMEGDCCTTCVAFRYGTYSHVRSHYEERYFNCIHARATYSSISVWWHMVGRDRILLG